jgi:outer membrane protein insertion porin family/translocation and assembly module TamA
VRDRAGRDRTTLAAEVSAPRSGWRTRARAALGTAVLLGFAAAPAVQAVSLDSLEPQREWRLAGLRFAGTHALRPGRLRAAMLTRPRPWFAVWRRPPLFDPVAFRTDLQRLQRLYESHGYYSAVITHDLEVPADADTVTAVVSVDEGAPVRVARVEVTFAGEPLPDQERRRLLEQLPLREGAVFTDDAYTLTMTALRTYYREHGYAQVEVTRAATVDLATHRASTTFQVASGRRYVFGDTRITGTRRITRGVVRRELTYDPGDPFQQSRVERTREHLVGLKLFRSVRLEEAPQPDGRLDMHVDVVEAPPREVRVGVGYDTEEQVRGLASWRSYSFFGGARQLGLSARASLIRRTLAADFLQPHFPGHSNRTRLLFAEQQEEEDTYDLDRTRLTPRFEWEATPTITGFAFYRAEYDSLSSVSDDVRRRRPGIAPRNAILSGFGFGADWNRTDDLLDPTRGWVASATVEPVGGLLGGDVSLLRLVGEGRVYQPLVGRLLAAGRLRLGAADPIAGSREIPLFERFYAGGLNSVRGYGRRRIGVLIDDDPIGGRSVVESSVELRHPITERITGAVFLDGGEVSERSFKFRFGHLRYGTGFGALVRSPIGPLRADLGFPVQPPDGDPRWQIHVSLGATF